MKLNWAERWAVNNPLRVLQQRVEIRRLKKQRLLREGSLALEIGCGRGAGAGILLKEFRLARLIAMDLDIGMVRKAQAHLPALAQRDGQQQRIFLLAGDVTFIPIKSGSLDAVFGFGVLHHVVAWRSVLREIARVLKPGGVYFFEELYPALYQNLITRHILLHPTKDRFTGPQLKEALAGVGLRLQQARELKKLGILGHALKQG
jgi:ubiquinone/menaquinone biosynthesis C-methylase UbiE